MLTADVESMLAAAMKELSGKTPDRLTLEALADAYEDAGDGAAAGAVRWLLREKVRPYFGFGHEMGLSWWNDATFHAGFVGVLPGRAYGGLRSGDERNSYPNGLYRVYDGLGEAIADLAQALACGDR